VPAGESVPRTTTTGEPPSQTPASGGSSEHIPLDSSHPVTTGEAIEPLPDTIGTTPFAAPPRLHLPTPPRGSDWGFTHEPSWASADGALPDSIPYVNPYADSPSITPNAGPQSVGERSPSMPAPGEPHQPPPVTKPSPGSKPIADVYGEDVDFGGTPAIQQSSVGSSSHREPLAGEAPPHEPSVQQPSSAPADTTNHGSAPTRDTSTKNPGADGANFRPSSRPRFPGTPSQADPPTPTHNPPTTLSSPSTPSTPTVDVSGETSGSLFERMSALRRV
jgi:hypothetical protein